MGVLNVTPDSFSDGGQFFSFDKAVAHGLKMVEEGVDIIDVGGESTRPGSDSVEEEEELQRICPVIETLAKKTERIISVDTVKPSVARAALARGATIVNDVSMLRGGLGLAEAAAEYNGILLIMHSRKTPKDMQREIQYDDVVDDVKRELLEAVATARGAGVKSEKIWLDPGIGFAKTAAHNLQLLARLPELVSLGFPVLVGPSRKSFIDSVCGANVNNRLGGTAAAVTASVLGGARAVRVHDVSIMRQAALIAHAIAEQRNTGNRHV